jgi:hypothetical protein
VKRFVFAHIDVTPSQIMGGDKSGVELVLRPLAYILSPGVERGVGRPGSD